jgi:hypothetical protein
MSTSKGAHFNSLGELGSCCIKLSLSFQVLPLIKQSVSKATQILHNLLQQVESGIPNFNYMDMQQLWKITLHGFPRTMGKQQHIINVYAQVHL